MACHKVQLCLAVFQCVYNVISSAAITDPQYFSEMLDELADTLDLIQHLHIKSSTEILQ